MNKTLHFNKKALAWKSPLILTLILCKAGLGQDGLIDPKSSTMYSNTWQNLVVQSNSRSCDVTTGTQRGQFRGTGTRYLIPFQVSLANVGDADWSFVGQNNTCLGTTNQLKYFSKFTPIYQFGTNHGNGIAPTYKDYYFLTNSQQYWFDAGPSSHPTTHYITKGWTDMYSSGTNGNWADMTGLPSGEYAIEITANPENLYPEPNDVEDDNAWVSVELDWTNKRFRGLTSKTLSSGWTFSNKRLYGINGPITVSGGLYQASGTNAHFGLTGTTIAITGGQITVGSSGKFTARAFHTYP